jgi:hypothetical protein
MVHFRIFFVILFTVIALTMIGVGCYFIVHVSPNLRSDTTSMGYLFVAFGAMYTYITGRMVKQFCIDF